MTAPPEQVLAAWGLTEAEALPGGQREAHRAGDVVLKPVAQTDRYQRLSDALNELPTQATVRIGLPVRSNDGRWVVDGWAATGWLDGVERSLGCEELLDVSARFHRAVADVPAAAVSDGRDQ